MPSLVIPTRLSTLTRLDPGSPLGLALASILAFSGVAASMGCDAPVPVAAGAEVSPRLPADAPPPPEPAPAAEQPANPLSGLERVDLALVGQVAEVLPAGGYTYFRLADGTWAVVMGAGPRVGARVHARIFAEKREFRSRRLGRTFAAVQFVSLTGG